MQQTGLIHLTQDQWLAIDRINDLLVETLDIEDTLYHGLESILSELNRPGGMIYFIQGSGASSVRYISINIPYFWRSNNLNHSDHLIQKIAEVACKTDTSSGGNTNLNLAGAFPISYRDTKFGALLLSGDELSENESAFCNFLLNRLGRVVYSRLLTSNNGKSDKEISFLKTLGNTQIVTEDINQTQYDMVKNIREYFEADYGLLILYDQEFPELIIKKLLGRGKNWDSQISQRMDGNILNRTIRNIDWFEKNSSCNDHELLSKINDFPGVEIQTLVCSPIAVDRAILGTLFLINPHLKFDNYRRNLLNTMTNLLANTLYNKRTFLQLKISNADLEARRLELLNSRNTLRTLFDSVPVSIYIVDQSYTILAINKDRCKRTNDLPSATVGRKCYEKLYSRTSPCPACRVSETMSFGRNTSRIWREWVSADNYIEWDISTFPIFNEAKQSVQVILFEQDVTDKRNLEANLVQSEKLAAVGQLAAGVAHEINNPLAAIIANAQILLQETPQDNIDLVDSLKLIEKAGIRASQVVRNLLGIARKENLEFEPIDLNETVKLALSLVQHELLKRPISVKLSLKDDLPLVMASRDHLQGVWINLFLNAIDAMDAADRHEGLLSISTEYQDSLFTITIADNGQGIEQEKLSRIFEPFFTTKSIGRGTGLGLSVCLRAIKQHQGNIQVDSIPGEGTRFTITIPGQSINEDMNL